MDLFEYALNKARELPSEKNRYRHYCVISDKRGRIVAEAANSYIKTHPMMQKASKRVGLDHKDFCHAEVLALIRARGRGQNLTVVRVGLSGKPLNSKPCPVCEEMIFQSKQIKNVSYSE